MHNRYVDFLELLEYNRRKRIETEWKKQCILWDENNNNKKWH